MRRLTTLFRTLRVRIRVRRCAACRTPDPAADGFCCEACRQDWADSIAY